jgi:hypothetical protein
MRLSTTVHYLLRELCCATPCTVAEAEQMEMVHRMQSAFETLRQRFAHSVHLIHPDDNLPHIVHTDASGKAVAVVFIQTKQDGETRTVSTASRVLTLAEQRYSTRQSEFLAIVYELQKFSIYVWT